MHASASARTLPFDRLNSDENERRRQIAEIDPRMLSDHLKRDAGLIDFDHGLCERGPVEIDPFDAIRMRSMWRHLTSKANAHSYHGYQH